MLSDYDKDFLNKSVEVKPYWIVHVAWGFFVMLYLPLCAYLIVNLNCALLERGCPNGIYMVRLFFELIGLLIGFVFGVLNFAAAYQLRKLQHLNFVKIVALLNVLLLPFGTILATRTLKKLNHIKTIQQKLAGVE